MKKFRSVDLYTHFLAISFLLFISQTRIIATDEAYISREELHEILDNVDVKYVYLGTECSSLYDVIARVNALEDNKYSVLAELKKHIEDGFSIGLHQSIIEALEYAERTLEEHYSKLDEKEAIEITQDLSMVINQVVNDNLTLSRKNVLPYKEAIENQAVTRCCNVSDSQGCPLPRCCVEPVRVVKVREPLDAFDKARFKKNVEIDGKLKVYGKTVFKEDVCFEDDVKFKDDVVFKDDVLIKGDLTVDGTVTFEGPIQGLTIIDVVIENLSATDIFVENLSAIDANIQHLTVTDLTVLSCMDHLCVNNLSVVDEVVTGTLSVNEEFVQTLTATDAVIDNLSVTDLVVLDCMDHLCVNHLTISDVVVLSCIDNLCVNNLSVVDEVVTGTLSVNAEVVQTLTATDAVIDNLSVTDLVVLSCMDHLCVNHLTISDVVVLSCIDNLCVNNLSVVDEVVTGTLSVNAEVVQTLTATDAVINNLSVTDLVVLDCMDHLCVNDLSVTDISAGSLSLCDLIVNCDIFMNDSTSPTVGNIMKAGNRFIHNYGTDNTFVGVNAGNFTMGGAENVGVGRNALFSNTTGYNNTSVGSFSMNTNTIGTDNSAYGTYALVNNTQGNQNVAVGNYTLATNTTGLGNTAVGFQAGYSLGTGNNNLFVGNNAGLNLATGATNVIIGYNSGLSLTTGNDNIYISNPGVATETGIIRIGTPATHIAAFMQGVFGTAVAGTGVAVYVDANGQLGTVVSSKRFKHNIEDMGINSEDIYKLRPVTFVYNNDETDTIQYGLIAEEVNEVFPELVVHDEEGKAYTVRYHLLPQLLLNEIQKLHTVVQDQAVAIHELKMNNKELNEVMNKVMMRLHQVSQ